MGCLVYRVVHPLVVYAVSKSCMGTSSHAPQGVLSLNCLRLYLQVTQGVPCTIMLKLALYSIGKEEEEGGMLSSACLWFMSSNCTGSCIYKLH